MKHLEDLTRMHISEAIQTGLKSQSTHRVLFGKMSPISPPGVKGQGSVISWRTGLVHRFLLLYQRMLNLVQG